MTDDKSFMEKIRQGIERRKQRRSAGGFPWLLIAIVTLVVVGMAFRGI